MNKFLNDFLKAMVMGFVVPAMLMGAAVGLSGPPWAGASPVDPPSVSGPVLETQTSTKPSLPTSIPATIPTTAPETLPTVPEVTVPPTEPEPEPIMIKVVIDGKRNTMELETYILGVLLAEMPVTFEVEALKAQAVAARTYTLRCVSNPRVHGGGVCTKSSCCQGYVSPEKYIIRGGKYENLEKMRKAVEATKGLVMTYKGQLILSTYFSCSGGRTETAMEVWGQNHPYLQSVPSPGEEYAEVYSDIKRITTAEFAAALGLELEGEPSAWFKNISYTTGGGILKMTIGDKNFKGTELRAALGLPSAAISFSINGDVITIKTLGYGHRIGMSQFGADAMARKGKTYTEILLHYYTGVKLEQYVA